MKITVNWFKKKEVTIGFGKRDKIVAEWTFNNDFHMEFGNWKWEVGPHKTNKAIIKEAQAKCGSATHISLVRRNGKIIYDYWEKFEKAYKRKKRK